MRNSKGWPSAILAAALVALAAGAASAQRGAKPTPWPRLSDKTAGKPRLGVRLLEISSDLRAYFGAPADRGVLVDSVVASSPAAKAGLRAGDVILVVDGDAAADTHAVLSAMSDRKKGDKVAIEVVRDRKRTALSVTLESDPGPVADLDLDRQFPGFRTGTDEMRRRLDEIERRLEQLEQAK